MELQLYLGRPFVSRNSFKHSDSLETLPAEPFYEPKFQSSLAKAKDIAAEGRDYLRECEVAWLQGSTLHALREQLERLSNFQCSSKRLIGVVGTSGAGKSSLINALLDQEGLAQTDASGRAVTTFPIEYLYREEHQDANFVIKIERCSGNEINESLRGYFDDLRSFHLSGNEDLMQAEFELAEHKSQAAEQVLTTAFCAAQTCPNGYPPFDLRLMKDDSPGAYDRNLSELILRGRELQWPKEMKDGIWEANADDVYEVHNLLKPFIDLGLWVFVRVTRIYLESSVIKTGLVLADLPGYHDLNFARVRAAKKHQAMCDEIFVVSHIKRAIDDPIIREVVQDYGQRDTNIWQLTSPRIVVVCTHSGEVGDIKDLEKHAPRGELKNVKEQLEKVRKSQHENIAMNVEASEEAQMSYDKLLMTSRNAKVESALKEKYEAGSKSGCPLVFCVDNRKYHNCRNVDEADLSGIPDLRRFCYSIPARAQFRLANHYLRTELPSLISSVDLWIQAARNPRMKSLAKIVSTKSLLTKLEQVVISLQNDLQGDLDDVVEEYNEKTRKITKSAVESCASWNKVNRGAFAHSIQVAKLTLRQMHHTSYRAFIRNYGTHCTSSIGYKCWNTELIGNANTRLAKQWISLDDEITNDIQFHLAKIKKVMKDFTERAVRATAPPEFVKNLLARERQIRFELEREFSVFQRSLGATKRAATSGAADSHIVTLLRPTYYAASMDCGDGVTKRNRGQMLRRVSKSGLFAELATMIETSFDEILREFSESIATIISERVGAIKADLVTMTVPEPAILTRYPEFGKRMTKMVSNAKKSLRVLHAQADEATEQAKELGYI